MIRESINLQPDYDKILSYSQKIKSDRNKMNFIGSITYLREGMIKKEFYNSEFVDNYSFLTRGLEGIFQAFVDETYTYARSERVRQNIPDGQHLTINLPSGIFALNSVNKLLKDWSSFGNLFANGVEFLKDIQPLVSVVKEAKTYIIKGRKPKPVDPNDNRFIKPSISISAAGEVKKIFSDILEAKRIELHNMFVKDLTKAYNVVKEKIDSLGANPSRDDKKKAVETFSDIQKFLFGRCWDYSLKEMDDSSTVIEKFAKDQTSYIIDGFLHKSIQKLSLIVEKKELDTHVVNYTTVKQGILENSMFFKFKDGSNFTVYTSTVYSYTSSGKLFVRFPTRFTNVTKADGTKMAMPSEEKMIKEF